MVLLLYNSNGKRHGRVSTISENGKTEKTKKKQIFSAVVTAQNYSVFIFVISRRCRGRSFIVFLWAVDILYAAVEVVRAVKHRHMMKMGDGAPRSSLNDIVTKGNKKKL